MQFINTMLILSDLLVFKGGWIAEKTRTHASFKEGCTHALLWEDAPS